MTCYTEGTTDCELMESAAYDKESDRAMFGTCILFSKLNIGRIVPIEVKMC